VTQDTEAHDNAKKLIEFLVNFVDRRDGRTRELLAKCGIDEVE